MTEQTFYVCACRQVLTDAPVSEWRWGGEVHRAYHCSDYGELILAPEMRN